MAQIAQKFEHFLDAYRRPDGSRWGGQDLHNATGAVVTRSYVSNLRKGRIENPGFEKLRAIAQAHFKLGHELPAGGGVRGERRSKAYRYAIQVGQRCSSIGSATTAQTWSSSSSP